MSHDLYTHHPLLVDRAEVRLVRILPGKDPDPVEIEILHVSSVELSPAVNYEALSYTWGDPQPSHEVLVRSTERMLHPVAGGEDSSADNVNNIDWTKLDLEPVPPRLPISQNLAIALKHLRYPRKERMLWIDAICINQKDVQERSREVGEMGRIFSEALRVIVWLGEESRDSSLAIRTLANLGSGINVHTESGLFHVRFKKNSTAEFIRQNYQTLRAWALRWVAIRDLLDRPWFKRLWVYQEIVLAADAIVMVGGDTISWTDFRAALLWIRFESKNRGPIGDIFNVHDLHWLKSLLGNDEEDELRLSMPLLIRRTMHRLCVDPRDRLYAILSLVDPNTIDGRLEIRPDYSKPFERVCAEFMVQHINATRGLHLMSLCTYRGAYPGHNQASWVPDLSFESRIRRFAGSFAAGDTSHELEASETDNHLIVRGLQKATVNYVSPPISPNARTAEILAVCHAWQLELDDAMDGPSYMDSSSWLENFIVLLAHGFRDGDKVFLGNPKTMTVKEIKRAYELAVRDGQVTENSKVYVQNIERTVLGRSFLRTEEGYFGLCNQFARPGDQIHIVLGCATPLVLRDSGKSPPEFQVVGTCFIPGLMQGEGLLGPFPSNWNIIRSTSSRRMYSDSRDPESGMTLLDPRCGDLPPGWEARYEKGGFDGLKDVDMKSRDHHFENVETGEKTYFDPRMSSEKLKEMGVDIRDIKLV